MHANEKKPAWRIILLLAFLIFGTSSVFAGEVKNVIVMIPDGMSHPGVTLTRWYQGGKPLAMDPLACGLVRTYSADAVIADSAPAATAMATGYKSHTGYIGVLPDQATMPGLAQIPRGDEQHPVATVLEAARLKGKATGLVATSEIMHATPAGFSSHDPSRKNYDSLSEQQVYGSIDVVLGGGYKFFTPAGRKDGEDLIATLKERKYHVITTPAELKEIRSGKVFGLFATEALSYELDRDPAKEPSLAEMTAKAIALLSQDKDGFFLMVEGSKVDWAAHANDPVGLISDIGAFDAAVKVALDFAKKDKRTALLIASDHGNGGISIGDASTTKTYDKTVLADYLPALKGATKTGEGIERRLAPDMDDATLSKTVSECYGISDLSAGEIVAIRDALSNRKGELNCVVGPMLSKRAHIGWTTGGHTGEDVVLYAYGPDRPIGLIENNDIARITARYLGLDLGATSARLFVEADTAFAARHAEAGTDASDPRNPVLVVHKGTREMRIPSNKDYAILNGKTILLDGVAVYNAGAWYVSRKAIDLIK